MSLEDDLRQIEEERAALDALVRSSTSPLATRPVSGEWSVVENLRHLLYAEERHLLRRLTPDFTWTAIGLPTRGIVKRSGAGSASSDDFEEVLAAWDATHQRALAAIRDAPAGSLPERLAEGNLRHLRAHIRIIRKLLDAPR
ncbi:MAG: DinB family protein [Dehalococcoidia bacterium]